MNCEKKKIYKNSPEVRERARNYYYAHREYILNRMRNGPMAMVRYDTVPHSPRILNIFKSSLYDRNTTIIENILRLRTVGRVKLANYISDTCLQNARNLSLDASG